MRPLRSAHVAALKAVRDGRGTVTSSGFAMDGNEVTDPAERDYLDDLWVDDLIDADIQGINDPAQLTLTPAGSTALARAEQESGR